MIIWENLETDLREHVERGILNCKAHKSINFTDEKEKMLREGLEEKLLELKEKIDKGVYGIYPFFGIRVHLNNDSYELVPIPDQELKKYFDDKFGEGIVTIIQ